MENVIHVEVWQKSDNEREDYLIGKGKFLLESVSSAIYSMTNVDLEFEGESVGELLLVCKIISGDS